MPPSRHSSSSHHSSPSHHSSSSSRSSGGPSRHSSSSHYSSSSYSGSSYSGSYRSSGSSSSRRYGQGYSSSSSASYFDQYPNLTRTRNNQPKGYTSKVEGYKTPKAYHCKNHDYLFYASPWTDPETGKRYEKGYYDEAGKCHKHLVIKQEENDILQFECSYCGTQVKAKWKEGPLPKCPNCSAQLSSMDMDVIERSVFDTFNYTPNPQEYREREVNKWLTIIFTVFIVFMVGIGAKALISSYFDNVSSMGQPMTMYVSEIGRECKWLKEYESYFDPVSNCYFWYNDEVAPPEWQYWYEGISSEYGEYGWMAFDEAEQQWYIEIDDGKWVVLPEQFKPREKKLWHIEE